MSTKTNANQPTPAGSPAAVPAPGGAGAPPPADPKPAAPANPAPAPAAGEQPASPKAAEPKAGEGAQPAAQPPADFELKFPDGIKVDAEMTGAFKDIAKEAGLTPEAAQKIADLYANAQVAAAKKAEAQFEQQVSAWQKELETDKDFGGANLEANKKAATQAIERFGSPELKDWFNQSGYGNHPALAKAFAAVGRAMAEDTIRGTAGGSGAPSKPQTTQEAFMSLYNKKKE